MTEHLVFTLAAPLASFGTIAVGERRPTWDRPSKSQVIGLVAAALGIERAQESRLGELAVGLGFAVRVDDPGLLAVDYHTAQTPTQPSVRRREKEVGPIGTRADELACDDLKTIVSRREFRAGSRHTIALWRVTGEDPTLAEMAQALAAPVFVPYVGRKAHPLMLPTWPRVVPASSVEQVFDAYDRLRPKEIAELADRLGLHPTSHRPIYCDASAIPRNQMQERVARLEERRDMPESRAKWRFGLRSEALLGTAPRRGGTS
jgi:CRISPR system Cascade subunit CasD